MPDSADIDTIGTDRHLCEANAYAVARWMGESATIYSLGKEKAKRFFFRLKGDPREVSEHCAKVNVLRVDARIA